MRHLLALALAGLSLAGLSFSVVPTAAAAAVPSCQGKAATIVGTPNDDRLVGTDERDVIWGGAGSDTILAGGGNDLVCGGAGKDRILGEGGDDRLHGGADGLEKPGVPGCLAGDRLDGGNGDDLLDPGRDPRRTDGDCPKFEGIGFAHGHQGVHVNLSRGTARGQGHDRIRVEEGLNVSGSGGDDVIVGSAYGERIHPLGGNDLVRTRGGTDVVMDGTGEHTGTDVFDLGADGDLALSKSGRDRILGGAGNDRMDVQSPAPVHIVAGSGDDEIERYRVVAKDFLSGGSGDDAMLFTLFYAHRDPVALDIPAGIFRTGQDAVHLRPFEAYHIFDSRRPVHVQGSDAADTVMGGFTTRIIAHMGGGDDHVETGSNDDFFPSKDDYVDGGDGTDYADLGTGSDTCDNVEEGPC